MKRDKLCDNDTQALVHDWLLSSFSLKSSCATFTRPAKAHICRIDHSGVNCSCESWFSLAFFSFFLITGSLIVNATTFKVFWVLHEIPEAEAFPECVNAFCVWNGLPVRPFHHLLGLLSTSSNGLRLFATIHVPQQNREILSDLRCLLFRWEPKAALYRN